MGSTPHRPLRTLPGGRREANGSGTAVEAWVRCPTTRQTRTPRLSRHPVQADRRLGVVTAPDGGVPASATIDSGRDGRRSWIPNRAMIEAKFLELRKRRGLMITLTVLTIGLPTLFLVIKLLLHAFAPRSYGPAGGFAVFTTLTAGVLYIFAFIVAMTLGATAGCSDLADGMFTQQVVTGRSRVALYLARIPAGLAIVIPMVAVAFTIICAVCVFSAPSRFDFEGTTVPLGLSLHGYETWAAEHANLIVCDFPYNGPCPENEPEPNAPLSRALAERQAEQNYPTYTVTYNSPPYGLMIRAGLWLELEAVIAYVFGLGFASLMGQRMVPIILMIVYEIIFRPLLLSTKFPHLINLQRPLVIELAVAHFEPAGIGINYGIVNGPAGLRDSSYLLPESTSIAIAVIAAWVVGWTLLGAWRMATRDA
jgi:hypothetical protein